MLRDWGCADAMMYWVLSLFSESSFQSHSFRLFAGWRSLLLFSVTWAQVEFICNALLFGCLFSMWSRKVTRLGRNSWRHLILKLTRKNSAFDYRSRPFNSFNCNNLSHISWIPSSSLSNWRFMRKIANAYPQVASLISIGRSAEGRDIFALTISAGNNKEDYAERKKEKKRKRLGRQTEFRDSRRPTRTWGMLISI